MRFAPYSSSKIFCHVQCNRKFKYNYITKPKKIQSDMTALYKGRAVHSVLEHHPNISPNKMSDKYKSITDKFISSDLGQKYLSGKSIREFEFGLDFKFEPMTYSKSALFRGKIDHISIINNTLYLTDYKTGKYVEEKFQFFDQLLFYSIYFFQKYPKIEKIVISYVYIEHLLENTLILDRKYLLKYCSTLISLIKNVENDMLFIKNPSKLCNWCDYREYCKKDKN